MFYKSTWGHLFSPGHEEYPWFYFKIFLILSHILYTCIFTKIRQINDIVFYFLVMIKFFKRNLLGNTDSSYFPLTTHSVYKHIYLCVHKRSFSRWHREDRLNFKLVKSREICANLANIENCIFITPRSRPKVPANSKPSASDMNLAITKHMHGMGASCKKYLIN